MAKTENIDTLSKEVLDVAVEASTAPVKLNKLGVVGTIVGGGLIIAGIVMGIRRHKKKKAKREAEAAVYEDEEYAFVPDDDFEAEVDSDKKK